VATRRWKIFEDMFIHFDRMYECDRHTDRQTDGQTPHDGKDRDFNNNNIHISIQP